MTYIVDASVAIKWFIHEDRRDPAMRLLDHVDRLHAPDLIVVEVASAVWKKCARKEIAPAQARAIAATIDDFIATLHASPELTPAALEIALRLDHPVYDCLYLACADLVPGVLVTDDKKIHRAVRGTAFEQRVRLLGDIGP